MAKQKQSKPTIPFEFLEVLNESYDECAVIREARGECPKCRKVDYTTLYEHEMQSITEFVRELKQLHNHFMKLDSKALLYCDSCRNWYRPNSIWLTDGFELEHQLMTMDYDTYAISKEERRIQVAKTQMKEYFEEHKQEFWVQYDHFALTHWTECVNELTEGELRLYYSLAGECTCDDCLQEWRGERQRRVPDLDLLRRRVHSHIKTDQEKLKFWHEANRLMIDYLREGIDLWDLEEHGRKYGKLRIAFIYFYLPIPKDLEVIRRPHIAKCLHQLRDTNTAIRHVIHLSEERERLTKEVRDLTSKLASEKAKSADLQAKVNQRQMIEQAKSEAVMSCRPLQDKKKIEGLKQLIAEMRQALSERLDPEPITTASVLEEDMPSGQLVDNTLDRLRGKTIAIIGGSFAHPSEKMNYPCKVVTHQGWQIDEDMLRLIRQSDVVIVLTRFIRHGVMWGVKEQCILQDKPVFFERNVNVNVLLRLVASKLNHVG